MSEWSDWAPAPDDNTILDPSTIDTSAFTDIPSELGGTSSDWLNASGGVPADPNTTFYGWGDLFGPGSPLQNTPLLGSGGGGFPGFPLDTSIPFSDPGGGSMGDGAGAFDFGAEAIVPWRCKLPWGSMLRMVRAAVRDFGTHPAIIQQVVSAVAAYWSQRTGMAVSPGALLVKYLGKRGRGRRTRGITGRQLSITRRTIGKVERMHQAIVSTVRGSGPGRARARMRCGFCRSSPCRCRRK